MGKGTATGTQVLRQALGKARCKLGMYLSRAPQGLRGASDAREDIALAVWGLLAAGRLREAAPAISAGCFANAFANTARDTISWWVRFGSCTGDGLF